MNSYLIEFFENESAPRYEFFFGEDENEAILDFTRNFPKSQIQNVALVLNLKEYVYEDNRQEL